MSGKAPEPAYAVGFSVEGGCLRAVSTGVIATVGDAIGLFRAVAVERRRIGAGSVLMVDETSGIVPDAGGFETLAAAMAGEGFEGVRVAYVDVAGTAIARVEVGEIVARSHGYRLRVFDNEAQARIWLRYGGD